MWVVKAQIHAGGRGKGGGVKVVKAIDEVFPTAEKMLGMTLVTKQTGPAGKEGQARLHRGRLRHQARALPVDADRPRHLKDHHHRLHRGRHGHRGGRGEDAGEDPQGGDRPGHGHPAFHGRKLAFGLKMEGKQINACAKFVLGMYKAFTELDASLVEINPLVVTGAGDVIALDAKMNFDDNALFRHKDIQELRDEDEEDPAEREAAATTSTTSSSTARSAAWSTAPAWRWRRWTSSSCTAAIRPTSSTSAAAPPRTG